MPIVTLVVSVTITYVCARILLFRSHISDISWAERARSAFPVRYAKTVVPWTCFGFLCMFFKHNHNPLLDISTRSIAALLVPATLLASIVADHAIAPLINDPLRTWARSFKHLAGAFLLSPGLLIIVITWVAMPNDLELRAFVTASLGFAALVVISLIGTLPLLCRLGLAAPASPRLRAAVAQATQATGITASGVFEIDAPAANAFALLFPQQLVFTLRAAEMLDHEKLVAVACHELAHLAEPLKVRWIRLAQVLVIYPLVFSSIAYERFGIYGILVLAAIYSVARKRFTAVRRRLEFAADTTAHQHQPNQGVYASALELLYQANNTPAVLRARRTHGNLYDRMMAAGATPDYPRPAPPSYARSVVPFAFSLVLLLGLQFGFERFSHSFWAAEGSNTEKASLWHLAIGGGGAHTVAEIAELKEAHGYPEQAAIFSRAASELDNDYNL